MKRQHLSGNMKKPRGIGLKELNPLLTCPLCSGYLIDATKLLDCLHTFCRSCIVKHFENSKCCPVKNCLQPYKDKKPDMTLQTLVYKIVPGLYSKEIQRRDDFYRSTDARASSSCSDDSLFGENNHEQEEWIHNLGQENPFLSPDDSISLSLEYYQRELDTTPIENGTKTNVCGGANIKSIKNSGVKCDRRYLQCPAAVQMTHLQKFIRMKFGLKDDHKVDIIHNGEVLPTFFTLMDVAYTFKWNRVKPLRFFYRIFAHVKIKPIRIINTTSSAGEKHHQIVSISANNKDESVKDFKESKELKGNKEETIKDCRLVLSSLEDEQRNKDKERLMNELKLQVRKKTAVEHVDLFRYGEDNNKEKFAENRDREWESLKTPDEEYKISKKRKKNKHSKDEHKKRKLHAEITSEESLKLKVKITPHNGHKHKHHKSVDFDQDVVNSKEKVSQLRQIRHKSSEPKSSDVKDFVQNKNLQYPPGFTVSRVESGGVKRKLDEECVEKELKKPSLEITLIRNPSMSNQNNQKRPPPATIPLQKIKNSYNFSSGVSIIPKIPEKKIEVRKEGVKNEVLNKNDYVMNKNEVRSLSNVKSEVRNVKNEVIKSEKVDEKVDKVEKNEKNDKNDKNDKNETFPLDLSKPNNNGLTSSGTQLSNLSNLQMLSKVASEHAQNLNKNKQIPNLQSIRLPFHHHQNTEKIAKSMPKLNEINKNDFLQNRMLNNSRINRPNQNQCIRNIPNPSLLVRQQNQNRLNCLKQQNNHENDSKEKTPPEKSEVKIVQKQQQVESNQKNQITLITKTPQNNNQQKNQLIQKNQLTQKNNQVQKSQNAQIDVKVSVTAPAANGKKEIHQNSNDKEKKDDKNEIDEVDTKKEVGTSDINKKDSS
nr:polycomb group protein Psc-like isoform X1 [Onthophagus taurus]